MKLKSIRDAHYMKSFLIWLKYICLIVAGGVIGFTLAFYLQPATIRNLWGADSAIATLLAVIVALLIAVWQWLHQRLDRHQTERHRIKVLKLGLTSEIFGFGNRLLEGHRSLQHALKFKSGATIHTIENATVLPDAVIYSANAEKLGLLRESAHGIILFYMKVENIRLHTARLCRDLREIEATANASESRPKVDHADTFDLSSALLEACATAADVLPVLAVGTLDETATNKFAKVVAEQREKFTDDNPKAQEA